MMDSTAYNKGGNSGCRVGNWVEEEALTSWMGPGAPKDLKPGQVDNTNARCIAHSRGQASADWRGEASSSYGRSIIAPNLRKPGPRSISRERALLEKAFLDTKSEEKSTSFFESTAKSTFTQSAVGAIDVSKVGRTVMQTQTGEHIPPEARDSEFLAEVGISKPRPKQWTKQSAEAAGSLLNKPPISIYSTRMAESTFPMTSTKSANPFAKSIGFSADMGHPLKFHSEGIDTNSGQPHPDFGAYKSNIGAEFSATPLLHEVLAQMKKNYGTGGLNTFYAVLKAEGDAETSMSQANLGHVLRVFDVALTAAQLAQMFSYFDRTCCGRISLSSVMDGFRACNPASCTPYRQALINAAFANNDDGAGSIDMSCLPFDDSSGLTQHMTEENMDSITQNDFVSYFLNASVLIEVEASFFELIKGFGVSQEMQASLWDEHVMVPQRILVTTSDGRATVQHVPAGVAIPQGGLEAAMKEHFKATRGMTVSKVDLL